MSLGLLFGKTDAKATQFKAEDFHKAMIKAKAARDSKGWKGNCLRESTNTLRILAGKQAVKNYHRTFFNAPCTYSIAGAKRPQRYLPRPKTKNFRLYSDFVWCEASKSPTGREGWFLVTHGRFARYKGNFVEGQIGDQVYIAEGINEGGRGFCLRHSIIFVGGEKGKLARYVCSLSSNPKGEPLRRYWGSKSFRGQLIHQVRRYHNLFTNCSPNANVCNNALSNANSNGPSSKTSSPSSALNGLSLLGSLVQGPQKTNFNINKGSNTPSKGSLFSLSSAGSKTSKQSKYGQGSSKSDNPSTGEPSPFDMGLNDWLEPGIPEEKAKDKKGEEGMQPGVMSKDDPFYEGVDGDDGFKVTTPPPAPTGTNDSSLSASGGSTNDNDSLPPLPRDPDDSNALMPLPDSWKESSTSDDNDNALCSYESSDGGNWDLEPEYDGSGYDSGEF